MHNDDIITPNTHFKHWRQQLYTKTTSTKRHHQWLHTKMTRWIEWSKFNCTCIPSFIRIGCSNINQQSPNSFDVAVSLSLSLPIFISIYLFLHKLSMRIPNVRSAFSENVNIRFDSNMQQNQSMCKLLDSLACEPDARHAHIWRDRPSMYWVFSILFRIVANI